MLVRLARSLVPLIVLALPGCTSVKMTGSARTGTEQLLLTGTWDNALSHVDFSALAGTKVYLDPTYVTVVDKDYIISSIRRTMAEQGLLLESTKDKAQNIVEVAIGAYGTDERDRKFGLPGLSIAPSLDYGCNCLQLGQFDIAHFFRDQPARRSREGSALRLRGQDPVASYGNRHHSTTRKVFATTS